MMQIQQLQRQYNQICQEMLSLQNVIGQIAHRVQQEIGQPTIRQTSYQWTPGNRMKSYSPGSPYGLPHIIGNGLAMGSHGNLTPTGPYGHARTASGWENANGLNNSTLSSTLSSTAGQTALTNTSNQPSGTITPDYTTGSSAKVGRQSEYSTFGRSV